MSAIYTIRLYSAQVTYNFVLSFADSLNYLGPVRTFYYMPLIYEVPALLQHHEDFHLLFKSSTWNFLETLFRHHLALLFPFLLALMVPVSVEL